MTALAVKIDHLSLEEYLEGERHSDIRHEYVDGQVYAMAGESKRHNTIAGNIYMALRRKLRGSPCRVFMEGVKVRVQTRLTDRFCYPDLAVTCAASADPYFETAPKLIVEVLSESTERKDRADKFHAYRQLESLEEYLLVAQDARRAELFRRRTGWEWELYVDEAAEIVLDSLKLTLDFSTIYEDAAPETDSVVRQGSGTVEAADEPTG